MGVVCDRCGEEWPRDPALEVRCPACPAGIGEACVRPSGHPVPGGVHASRDRAAMRAGVLRKCSGRAHRLQGELFS